jgi:cell division septum initiation protein DivIVA
MTDVYTKQLIDLLNDKIRRLEQEKDSQRKEINRLKKELSDYKRRCDA